MSIILVYNNKGYMVPISGLETVETLKKKIEYSPTFGIRKNSQILIYKDNADRDVHLDDDNKPLSFYGFPVADPSLLPIYLKKPVRNL